MPASTPLPEHAPPALWVDGEGEVWTGADVDGATADELAAAYPFTLYLPAAVAPSALHEFPRKPADE